ncbi:uncharacterized protein H6S33_011560 [Morchella sextelata]|uniref:uncharacterized protein n=1 Tax=Morchella sextelata TaxID=1174677 RepID=UPI001D0443A1|nr:uncharacterized protein H6S33_011560 [Morchella sextelata]KAH0611133.1 hypothetical protein H6S33_011560 [Morchella sextelata]
MSGVDNTQPSTVKSYIDSGVAAVQNAVGSLTGNPADQQAADNRKAHADLEHDASHASAKAGPFNLSSSGAATIDNKNRRDGKADQLIGSGKEFVGNAVGSDNLRREGRQQNSEGQGKEAAGQVADFASGVVNRVTGTIGSVASGIVGNKEAQTDFNTQHDKGKTSQRGVEADLQK